MRLAHFSVLLGLVLRPQQETSSEFGCRVTWSRQADDTRRHPWQRRFFGARERRSSHDNFKANIALGACAAYYCLFAPRSCAKEYNYFYSTWYRRAGSYHCHSAERVIVDPLGGASTLLPRLGSAAVSAVSGIFHEESAHSPMFDLFPAQPAQGVNTPDIDLYTALHRATEGGHTGLCRLLLENGADPNVSHPGLDGWAVLHLARWCKNLEVQ